MILTIWLKTRMNHAKRKKSRVDLPMFKSKQPSWTFSGKQNFRLSMPRLSSNLRSLSLPMMTTKNQEEKKSLLLCKNLKKSLSSILWLPKKRRLWTKNLISTESNGNLMRFKNNPIYLNCSSMMKII